MMLIPVLIFAYVSAAEDINYGQSISTLQSSEWAYYTLSGTAQAYNLVELELQPPGQTVSSWPMLLLRKGEKPSLTASMQPVSDYIDLNAWASAKLNHNIQFSGSYNNSSEPIYLGVYVGSTPWTYSLSVSTSGSPLCPFNCTGRGGCEGGKCACAAGFVDVDCSVSAVLLAPSTSQTVKSTNSTPGFAYVNWNDCNRHLVAGAQVTISITWSQGNPLIISKSESPNFKTWMPTKAENNGVLISNVTPITLTLSQSDLTTGCNFWYFAVSNLDTSTKLPLLTFWNLQVTADAGLNKLLVVLVSLSCGLVVFWACFAVYKWRHARTDQAPDDDYRIEQPPGLPKSQIDTSFPILVYSNYMNTARRPGDQDKCPICLEAWVSDSSIRVLTCEHIYHSKCIDAWFQENTVSATQFCCMCKRDFCELSVSAMDDNTNALYSDAQEGSFIQPANRVTVQRIAMLPPETENPMLNEDGDEQEPQAEEAAHPAVLEPAGELRYRQPVY